MIQDKHGRGICWRRWWCWTRILLFTLCLYVSKITNTMSLMIPRQSLNPCVRTSLRVGTSSLFQRRGEERFPPPLHHPDHVGASSWTQSQNHKRQQQIWMPLDVTLKNPCSREQFNRTIANLLICGDGDLSFSASVAEELAESNLDISLTATVLEDESTHQEVYTNSRRNTQTILTSSTENRLHDVKFCIDATDLQSHFGSETKFDRIQFNFPHWRGKCNNRYNRELLSNVLRSASNVISPTHGEIHIALCDGQGGTSTLSMIGWRQSWMAAQYAAEHGLLLADVTPFECKYDRSSHRGVDRPFRVGRNPKMYKFIKPSHRALSNGMIPIEFQLSCRHELHILLPPTTATADTDVISHHFSTFHHTEEELLHGTAVVDTIRASLPPGIRVDIPKWDVIETQKKKKDDDNAPLLRMAVFLIVYSGQSKPITREEADTYRETTERVVSENLAPLRPDRMGRLVSRPFPYRLLKSILEDN